MLSGTGPFVALVDDMSGGAAVSLSFGRLGFLALEQWQSAPSLQRQMRVANSMGGGMSVENVATDAPTT